MTPNAIVEYIDANTGRIVASEPFRDPGLDPDSWYARERKTRGIWCGPHMAYSCGALSDG